jgi:two-component system, NarL family, nitrate/nitrite response regulator NarL
LTVIDVIIAEPQPLFRDALARVVHQDPELHLAAEADEGHAALAAIREHEPEVALIARDLSPLDGDRVLAAVVRGRLRTRIVLLDAAPGPKTWALLGEGAAGLLSRSVTADMIRRSVHRVARGGIALCDEAQAAIASESRALRPRDHPLLSPREQAVLEFVADGLNAPAIAGRLQLATSTVRTHIAHLYDKLEVNDRGQLVHVAMRRGLLE